MNVDIMLNAEDVLDISDPTSGIFDDEMKDEALNMLQEQIQDLEFSISEREYELQGSICHVCPVRSRADRFQHQRKGIRVFRHYVRSLADRKL